MTQSRASANACSARPPLVGAERACETNVVTPRLAQSERASCLDPGAAVAEHQPLLAAVQAGDDQSRRWRGCRRSRASTSGGRPRRRPGGVTTSRGPAGRPVRASRSSSSGLPTVADRPMRWSSRPGEPREPFQHRQQVPAPVVAGEGVHLVDDHGPHAGEEAGVVDARRDQHRLERLRGGEQDVGRVGAGSGRRADWPMSPCQSPTRRPTSRRSCSSRGVQVVEQRPQRADVEHRRARASPPRASATAAGRPPPRSCRRRWGRAASTCSPARIGSMAAVLQRPQRRPAQGVDDVVLRRPGAAARSRGSDRPGTGPGRCRRPSRAPRAALRSTSVSSLSTIVSA